MCFRCDRSFGLCVLPHKICIYTGCLESLYAPLRALPVYCAQRSYDCSSYWNIVSYGLATQASWSHDEQCEWSAIFNFDFFAPYLVYCFTYSGSWKVWKKRLRKDTISIRLSFMIVKQIFLNVFWTALLDSPSAIPQLAFEVQLIKTRLRFPERGSITSYVTPAE